MDEKMCEIKFLPDGVTARVAAGTPLTEAADAADVRIGRHCGGAGVCGKCRVKTGADDPLSPIGETEKNALSESDVKAGMRLSCCARVVRSGSVTVVDPRRIEGAQHTRRILRQHLRLGARRARLRSVGRHRHDDGRLLPLRPRRAVRTRQNFFPQSAGRIRRRRNF